MFKKIILSLVLMFSLAMMINNAYHYPVNSGYDAMLHLRYAKIISEEGRIPTFQETRENYNPPLFYLASGLTTRVYSYFTGLNFFEAAKVWQYVNIVLALVSFYLWLKIIKSIYPKTSALPLLFAILLLSLPVWYKTIVMFSIETWFLFTVSLMFWFFITRFLVKPNNINLIILSVILVINLLSRLSAFALMVTVGLGVLSLGYIKKIRWQKAIIFAFTMVIIVSLGTGWFYLGRKDEGIYGVGEGVKPQMSFNIKQQVSFYTEIPFRLMMNYPIRFAPNTPLNRLVPIYYSEFWGDWWNYFSQRRFGISQELIRADRYFTSQPRINNLAWQNKINFPLTILMVLSLVFAVNIYIRRLIYRKTQGWLIKSLLLSFFLLTWTAFLIMLFLYPSWKGDSIKASYMLSLLPIQIILLTDFIFSYLKFNKFIYYSILVLILTISLNNLIWSWY